MEPRISIITLGVADLEASTRFYRDGLGFPVHDAGGPSITFFLLAELMLALYPLESLADETGSDLLGDMPEGQHAFTIAHNVANRAEVDNVLLAAEAAGARIVKPAAPTFWGGYSGYFADPDGFKWEIATGSGLPVDPSA
ncbi:MAG: VOC family protein [Chloroflexi bacterium]|nr:VOC family protein [Chloroflexota bacterium]